MPTSTCTLADGARLVCDKTGNGPPIVLISGLGGTSAFWRPLASQLEKEFTVLGFDQRGIARSTLGQAETTMDQLATDAMAVIDHAFAKTPVTVIGHSTGGAIAQMIGHRFPQRVRALVLSGTWLKADSYMRSLFEFRCALLDSAPQLHEGLSRLLSHTPSPSDDESVSWDDLTTATPMPTPEAAALFKKRVKALLSFDGRTIAPNLAMPCLVIGARDDRVVPFHHQQQVNRAVTQSRLHALDWGGHFYPRTHAKDMAAVVLPWLRAL